MSRGNREQAAAPPIFAEPGVERGRSPDRALAVSDGDGRRLLESVAVQVRLQQRA
jgi:hypothetical protein